MHTVKQKLGSGKLICLLLYFCICVFLYFCIFVFQIGSRWMWWFRWVGRRARLSPLTADNNQDNFHFYHFYLQQHHRRPHIKLSFQLVNSLGLVYVHCKHVMAKQSPLWKLQIKWSDEYVGCNFTFSPESLECKLIYKSKWWHDCPHVCNFDPRRSVRKYRAELLIPLPFTRFSTGWATSGHHHHKSAKLHWNHNSLCDLFVFLSGHHTDQISEGSQKSDPKDCPRYIQAQPGAAIVIFTVLLPSQK